MVKPLLVGNWKTGVVGALVHKQSADLILDVALAQSIVDETREVAGAVDLVVCPPFTSLIEVKSVLKDSAVFLGVQTVAHQPENEQAKPVTGEIPLFMLEGVADYAIIGHSERQANCAEDWQTTLQKFKLLANAKNVSPVVCLSEYGDGVNNVKKATEQIGAMVEQLLSIATNHKKFAIAYEPAWAIGGAEPAGIEYVDALTSVVRQTLPSSYGDTPILYGGSVAVNSAGDLAKLENVNGFLLGRASLNANQFAHIAQSLLNP